MAQARALRSGTSVRTVPPSSMSHLSIAWNRLRSAVAATTACAAAACVNLAPHGERPQTPLAPSWSGHGEPSEKAPDGSPPAADANALAWDAFIADDRLRAVVDRSLRSNRDLRIAALRVERARALYRVQRSAGLPAVQGGAAAMRSRVDGVTASDYTASVGVSYEIDLFGRLRNLSDAALAAYFSTDETRRGAQVLLVSEVATAWLTLAADQQRVALSRRTLESQQRTLDLATRMRSLGASTGLAVAQVRSTVEASRIQVAVGETQVALDRNALELLLGESPDERLLPDAGVPDRAALLFDVPPALPSAVLVERPDVRAAERDLEAANANIGAARAAYFPRIVLTSAAGTSSAELKSLFGSGSGYFSFSPTITLPIFTGGLNDASLAAARIDRDIAVAAYERSLQTAFREVADVLAARATLRERTAGQLAFVDALETSFRLSDAVFRQGGSTYLTVLEAQRSLFGAQQGLISLRLEDQATRIALYKALGGGWNQAERIR